jgi:BON domain
MARPILVLVPLLFVCIGCQDSDREQLRKIGGKLAEHLQTAAGGPDGRINSSLEALRGAAGDRTADSRVATRLRWDKAMVGAAVTVQMTKPGVVVLEGTVPSADARAYAVTLARATTGVEEVIDKLTVVPQKK